MKPSSPCIATAIAVVFTCLGAMPVSATPAFSRQINADCKTCHFQDMHSLNRFGREFKKNAFHETPAMRKELMHRAHRERKNTPNNKAPAPEGHEHDSSQG